MSKSDDAPAPPSRFRRIARKIWWLHSFGALSFGIATMMFARAGLKYADKVLIALFGSWLLMFVALRFVVGPANRKPDEKMARRGIRVVTNYIIKQFYQQMFFFLVPLYASSATWSFSSGNWWIAPVLLVCGVLSTLDLIFDHFIMERRWLASVMYGLAMFGVLNVLLPLVFGVTHLAGLFVAAAATPAGVALLTFSVKSVMSPQGVLLTLLATAGLLGGVWVGRGAVPPAPLAMTETAVGHGTMGSEECLPPSKHVMKVDGEHPLTGLRCGSLLREPGGIKEAVEHVWKHNGHELARVKPDKLTCDGEDGAVFMSFFPEGAMPKDSDRGVVVHDDDRRWTAGGDAEVGGEGERGGRGDGDGNGNGISDGNGIGDGIGIGIGNGGGIGIGIGDGIGIGNRRPWRWRWRRWDRRHGQWQPAVTASPVSRNRAAG